MSLNSVVIPLLALISTLSSASCGLLNLFNTSSDYNLASAIDTAFAKSRNDIGLLLTGDVSTPIEEDVTFWCGNRLSPELNQTLLDDPDVHEKINFTKPIMLITHGWLDDHKKNWIQNTAQDAMENMDINVCVVGWGNLARYVYYQSARKHTLLVSKYMTEFINFLNKEGMALEDVSLAGHSLGAQICGQVGYNLKGKLGAIYGIDPAGPLFTFPLDNGLENRLDSSDAKYVQMIITSRGTLGVRKGEGHENFYPNGGDAPQPNCVLPLTSDAEMADQIVCSHLHATSLFRFSLDPKMIFKGRKCFNWMSYFLKSCSLNPANVIGVHSQKIGGDFYLRTSDDSPYV
ncbi:lipase member H-B [Aedes aegypti]|uniref:Lipase domain-containing protein n=1 Tax=Aedes aegypti TaxID=7159 RepID=A0A1S4EWJ7_AEDAE|nr:lipase member H-B [Aedes aegypti]